MSSKRERELARAKFERQSKKRTSRSNRNLFIKVTAYSIAGLFLLSYLVLPQSNDQEQISPDPTTSSIAAPIVDGCTSATTPRANNISYTQVPEDLPTMSTLTLATNCGDFVIEANKNAPKTTGVMAFLANNKFFDGIQCHRLTTSGIYVLQCGDPAGDGTGGPGFTFEDENLPKTDSTGSAIYARGTVAMANSGPNTNGSQFFLVYQDSTLPANYSIWGQITQGIEQLDAIAAAGIVEKTAFTAPAQEVVISTAITTP